MKHTGIVHHNNKTNTTRTCSLVARPTISGSPDSWAHLCGALPVRWNRWNHGGFPGWDRRGFFAGDSPQSCGKSCIDSFPRNGTCTIEISDFPSYKPCIRDFRCHVWLPKGKDLSGHSRKIQQIFHVHLGRIARSQWQPLWHKRCWQENPSVM